MNNSSAVYFIGTLRNDVGNHHLDTTQRANLLLNLKILGRDANNVRSIYSSEGLVTVGHYAFGDYPQNVSHEALRCIANALFLLPETRWTFWEAGLASRACEGLKRRNDDDEFLFSRILFYMTYEPKADFGALLKDDGLAEAMIDHFQRHVQEIKDIGKSKAVPPSSIALAETLKLFFNVTNTPAGNSTKWTHSIPPLLDLLTLLPLTEPFLQPPISHTINALANLDFSDINSGSALPSEDQYRAVSMRGIDILEETLRKSQPQELETSAIPLLTVLRGLVEIGPQEIRDLIKSRLLPAESERDQPLGKSSSLASQLLRLTTAPGLSNIPEAVSSLLFELSDKDANEFVKNVGYGYAAGYLMSHQIPIPESARRNNTSNDSGQRVPVNPVTGQRLDKEEPVTLPDMTDEEKEREAERLYVLFERLKATGVIDVQNPVHQASGGGRFEELSESDSDS